MKVLFGLAMSLFAACGSIEQVSPRSVDTCERHADCGTDERCVIGACVFGGCEADIDCAADERCNSNGACQLPRPGVAHERTDGTPITCTPEMNGREFNCPNADIHSVAAPLAEELTGSSQRDVD